MAVSCSYVTQQILPSSKFANFPLHPLWGVSAPCLSNPVTICECTAIPWCSGIHKQDAVPVRWPWGKRGHPGPVLSHGPKVPMLSVQSTLLLPLGIQIGLAHYGYKWLFCSKSHQDLGGPLSERFYTITKLCGKKLSKNHAITLLRDAPGEQKGTCPLNQPQWGDKLWLMSWCPVVLVQESVHKGSEGSPLWRQVFTVPTLWKVYIYEGKELHLLRRLKIKRSYYRGWKPNSNIWTLCNIFSVEKAEQLNHPLVSRSYTVLKILPYYWKKEK